MSMRMLIDARHPEETRVAVVKGNRIEEFDFESAEHKQLKGNIYLAKVTRVEPSLQAAFIDYGGNRHGFLAFSEIHPDYYQIPVADRQALLAEEAEAEAEADARAEAAEVRGQVAGGDMEIEPPSRDVHAEAPAEGEPHEALPAQASHSDEIRSEPAASGVAPSIESAGGAICSDAAAMASTSLAPASPSTCALSIGSLFTSSRARSLARSRRACRRPARWSASASAARCARSSSAISACRSATGI